MARIHDTDLARFLETKAAWIVPDGSLRPAPALLEHLSALRGTEFAPLVAACEREVAAIKEAIDDTLEAESEDDPDSHLPCIGSTEPRTSRGRRWSETSTGRACSGSV